MGSGKYQTFSTMGARSPSNSNLGNSAASFSRTKNMLGSPVRSQVGNPTSGADAGGISHLTASAASHHASFSAKVDNPLKTMNEPSKNLETGSVMSEAAKSIGQVPLQVNSMTSGFAAMKFGNNDENSNAHNLAAEKPALGTNSGPATSGSLSFQPVSKYTRQLMEQQNQDMGSYNKNEQPTKLVSGTTPFTYTPGQSFGNNIGMSLKDTLSQNTGALAAA